jgi:fructoselysine-6-P-deglycase FrlB-like protein
MNYAFTDIYAILDCFIGNGKASSGAHGEMVRHGAHDEEAMRIATEGKEWAESVVRRENILVYLGRGSSGEGYMGDIEALESQLGHIARIRSDETAETILL